MRQYTPFGMEAYPELDRKITDSEYEDAVHLFSDLGLAGSCKMGSPSARALSRRLTGRACEGSLFKMSSDFKEIEDHW